MWHDFSTFAEKQKSSFHAETNVRHRPSSNSKLVRRQPLGIILHRKPRSRRVEGKEKNKVFYSQRISILYNSAILD